MSNTGFESNVDPNEVGLGDALASEWWDESGPLRTLHHLNPVRADYIVQRTGGLSGLRVVDVGCGGGTLTEALARAGANVLGIDPLWMQPNCIATKVSSIRTMSISGRRLWPNGPERTTSSPVSNSWSTSHSASTIEACASLARPGGHAFLDDFAHGKAYALAIVGAEYVARLLPRARMTTNDEQRPPNWRGNARAWLRAPSSRGRHARNPLARRQYSRRHRRTRHAATFTR